MKDKCLARSKEYLEKLVDKTHSKGYLIFYSTITLGNHLSLTEESFVFLEKVIGEEAFYLYKVNEKKGYNTGRDRSKAQIKKFLENHQK